MSHVRASKPTVRIVHGTSAPAVDSRQRTSKDEHDGVERKHLDTPITFKTMILCSSILVAFRTDSYMSNRSKSGQYCLGARSSASDEFCAVKHLPMAVLLSRDAASKVVSRNYKHVIRVETRVKTEQCRCSVLPQSAHSR